LTDIAGSREATLAGLYRLRGAVERLEIRREAVEGLATELAFLHARSRQSGSAEGRAELVQLERAHARARDELQKAELGERECELALQRSLAELAGLERIELARLENRVARAARKEDEGGERPRRGRFAAGGGGT